MRNVESIEVGYGEALQFGVSQGTYYKEPEQLLTEAYEAGKREQAAELDAARAEIELERTSLQQTERLLHKPAETIAAQQARIWELRNALSMPCDRWNKTQHGIVCKALSTPSDTSALEAIVKKAGEVMRERSINVAWNNEPDCNGPIEMEIRALPAVTLDDLK